MIEQRLKESGVAGENLELEITEGVLMKEEPCIDDALTALSKLGIKLAMDDFGTGYSSLSYLRRYPFSVLKIDRCFIEDIDVNQSTQELVNAAIVMAHALKLKVVAEGVETQAQFDLLQHFNCDYAQGYLLGKPIPHDQMTESLRQER